MKITHEKGSNKVAFDSLGAGEVVRDSHGTYGIVVYYEHGGARGLLWLDSGVVVFGVGEAALFEVVDAEMVIRGGGDS